MTYPTFPTAHEPTASEFQALLELYAPKTVDEAVTSSTTLQNDDELFLAVAASCVYELQAFLIYDGAGANGLKVGWTGPSGATLDWWLDGNSGGNSSSTGTTYWGYTQIGSANNIGAAGAGSKLVCRPAGRLITSTTPGTLQLQWAQGSSSATATHIFANSYLRLKRIQ